MTVSPLENLINSKLTLERHLYLKNAKFDKENSALFLMFYSDKITEAEKDEVYSFIKNNMPSYIKRLKIEVKPLETNEETVKAFLLKIIKEKYPLIEASILKDIDIKRTTLGFKITIKCDESAAEYINKINAVNTLTENLTAEFFDNFKIIMEKEKIIEISEIQPEEIENEVYYSTPNRRLIEVSGVAPLCGSLTDNTAFYIEDIKQEISPCVICGKISSYAVRETKNGKIMVTFNVIDFTGKLRCLFFPAKAVMKKLETLTENLEVLLGGSIKDDSFNGGLCMMVKSISLCKLPNKLNTAVITPDFKKENSGYKTVFPRKVAQATQSSLFETVKIKSYFENKTFVAFDIETTGLNFKAGSKITEIGAVKIFNGIVCESFSTLIDPEVQIPPEITNLTGITDEMVKGKPRIEDVIPDFYKFTRNCLLVAHNAEFDVEFIKFFGKTLNYNFDNEVLDTVRLGRAKVKLSNYKLQTLAEALKVPLKNHHRAVDDAVACAEIFLKLNG